MGSHLCDLLLGEGHEVVAVDNFVTGSASNVAHLGGRSGFSLVEADVCDGLRVDGPVDFVLHFASPASPDDFKRIPIEVMRAGSIGTENALELALARGASFMLASTSEVYGDPAISPQPESYWGNVNPIGPRSCYDEAKRYGEALTMSYRRARGVDTKIVRFFNTYGPRMRLDDGRVVPNFIKQALTGKPLTVYGDGKQTRSFGYVADIVRGVYLLMQSDCWEPVNLGTQEERTILEFAVAVLKATGRDNPIVHLEAAKDDPKQRRPDTTRAETVLGWKPSTSLDEGLRRTIEYFQAQLVGSA